MLFILLILGTLVVIGCIAAAFYLSPKNGHEIERQQREALAQEMVAEARAAGLIPEPEEAPVVDPLAGRHMVVVTRDHTDPIVGALVTGSYLYYLPSSEQWMTAEGSGISSIEIQRLLTLGVVARLPRPLIPPRVAIEGVAESFRALQDDFRNIQADMQRSFAGIAQMGRPRSTNVNVAQRSTAPATPAEIARAIVQPKQPQPAKPTPKSAFERLLSDDDLIKDEDDSGVSRRTEQ